MDIFALLFLSCISIIFGIILTLVLQYYVLVRYFNKGPVVETPKTFNTEAYSLPEELKKKLGDFNNESIGSCLPISLMLQFLFHELRHSDNIKRWIYKKLSLEFDELLNKTTIGKFFEVIKIRDMHLGTQFPDIKEISLDQIKMDKSEGHIDTIDLLVKLDYTGNFLLSVDAKMKFGKTAYLSIKVQRIAGIARLQFTRVPYTHWSFSFYTEPLMEFAVESHFQGRQLQSNITNLIMNQIKKAIKRKHTLPNYKIRYKPFFVKTDPGQMDVEENEIMPQGQLELSCTEVSRLDACPDIIGVYCTFTVDNIPFISVSQKDEVLNVILELTMTKIRQQQLGVIFKQELHGVVVVNVTPLTPASNAGLKPGDVVLAIENKNITNVSQIGKIIKSISSINISIKVERCTNEYVIKNCDKSDDKPPTINILDDDGSQTEQESFVLIEKPEETEVKKIRSSIDKFKCEKVPKLISSSNENMSKFAQTIGNFTLRKRKPSVERTSTDSSNRSTPNPSCPNTPQHSHKQNITIPTNFILTKKHSISEVPEIIQTSPKSQESELHNLIEIHKGRETLINSFMLFNDHFVFDLKESCKYLNVNVWGTTFAGKDTLLGYTNIPLAEILSACCNSMLGHYIRSYSFLPPNNTPPNSQTHPLMTNSGFEHVFCYGDILLSFVWNHEDNMEIRRKNSVVSCESDDKPISKQVTSPHDFVRTQFHRSIHCDFCSKKIWLKDAVQCILCKLCCHKKCISKCQLSTDCVPVDGTKNETSENHPDIVMTDVGEENNLYEETNDNKNYAQIKRVNSANNLNIPGAHVSTCQSRSLPPSPQRTPSRKQSLVTTNPFTLCASALDEVQNNPHEGSEIVMRLLDQIMLSSSDETLMDTAKESGHQMYANMEHQCKMDKINIMMAELKNTFDIVTMEHSELCRQMAVETSEVEKAKLAFLMGQADSKMHSLSVLMLHYCSGLQQSHEKIV